MNLTRPQLALMITAFSMGIVVLTLFNIHLNSTAEEEYVIEMSLADDELEALLEEKEQLEEELAQADPIKSHMALNETAKPSIGNPEPLKTLDQLLAERAANSESYSDQDPTDTGEYSSQLQELAKRREETKQLLGELEAEKTEYTHYQKERRTSISFSLVDRNARELPPPIYTCIEGGKVVVNIEVDHLGYVLTADFNESSSNTSNGCLVEMAIQYALRARFSKSDRAAQKGTITYLFQRK